MIVHLSLLEGQFAELLAQTRNDKPERVNKKFTPDASDEYIHYLSALAEVAWAKRTRWPIDIDKRAGGDGGTQWAPVLRGSPTHLGGNPPRDTRGP